MKAAVIVDSTAYLSEALAQHPDVYQVALSVNFSDGSVMKDTSDLQLLNEFYTRLKSESQLPTTSQPQPGDYLALLDQLVAAGYDKRFHKMEDAVKEYCELLDNIEGYLR